MYYITSIIYENDTCITLLVLYMIMIHYYITSIIYDNDTCITLLVLYMIMIHVLHY